MIDVMQEADFVGKKALRRIKEQGVSRKLIGFEPRRFQGPRHALERLPSDPTDTPRPDTRPRPARGNGRRARSTPLPQEFPAISSSYVLRPSARSSSATLRRSSRSALTLLLAGVALTARLEQLVAPAVIQHLRDPVLAADILCGPIAAQPRQHDLQVLLCSSGTSSARSTSLSF